MKKILSRVMAAAIAVPMALSQGVLMNISAADADANVKEISIDTLTAIPADKTESSWNATVMSAISNIEGQSKTIAKADFVAMLPETNANAVLLKDAIDGASDPVLSVEDNNIYVRGTVDLGVYAAKNIYPEVRKALKEDGYTGDVVLNAFDKVVSYEVEVNTANVASAKTADVKVSLDINATPKAFVEGMAKDLALSVAKQVGTLSANVENALNLDILTKLDKVDNAADKALTVSRTISADTVDELYKKAADEFNSRYDFYTAPATFDDAVSKFGAKFDKAVETVNDMTATNGYVLNISANDVAELAKSGSNFEASAESGVYNVTFQIPDAEAKEVEAYVNANAETGKAYDYSYKIVEAKVSADSKTAGSAYVNVERVIVMKDVKTSSSTSTTTTTTTTTTSSTTSSTTTTTTTTSSTSSTSSTTSSTTTSSTTSSTTTTTTTTGTGPAIVTVPEGFVLEDIEVTADKGFYFSHDTNEFDLSELVTSLTLVGKLNGEDYTVALAAAQFGEYLKPEFATPADYFNAVEGTAYVASELALTFVPSETLEVAEDADLTVDAYPVVYIGVKGDANLDGAVGLADASAVLTYYAKFGAEYENIALYEGDADLNTLAFFLADVNTESKAGANTDTEKLEIIDASNILKYYGMNGAEMHPTWSEIVG